MPPILDTRRLLAFATVATRGSFARAARELNLTPSAVSHAIRGFEDELGVRLFERRGRHVQLTVAGRCLAERAGPILRDLRDTRQALVAFVRPPA